MGGTCAPENKARSRAEQRAKELVVVSLLFFVSGQALLVVLVVMQ